MATSDDTTSGTREPRTPQGQAQDTGDAPRGGSANVGRRMGIAALILSGGVLLSRLVGYLREAIIAAKHGASASTDAYFAAFTLPDLMNYMVAGGALSITFIPIFSSYLARGREEDGWDTFSLVATSVGVVLLGLVVLGEIYTEAFVSWLVPGFSVEVLAETVRLTRIVLPGQLAFYWGGLIQATILSRQRFGAVAMIPVVYNLCIIAGGLLLDPWLGIAGFAWGALAGAWLGAFALPLIVQRRRLRFRLRFSLLDPRLRRFVALSLPVMLGFSLVTVDEWILRWFGSELVPGTISWLNNARRLMLVPIAVLGQAAGQATLPFLTRLYSEGRREELATMFSRALGAVLFVTLGASVWMAVHALPIVQVFYERGAYTAHDSQMTAELLRLFALGIAAWSVQAIAARLFYSMMDTWTPMLVSSLVVLMMLPIYAWLAGSMQQRGLALTTSLGMLVTAIATLAVLRWRASAIHVGALVSQTLRSVAAALIAGAAAFATVQSLGTQLGTPGLGGRLLILVLGSTAFLLVWLLAARVLRVEAFTELLGQALARLDRSRPLPGGGPGAPGREG